MTLFIIHMLQITDYFYFVCSTVAEGAYSREKAEEILRCLDAIGGQCDC